MTRWTRTFIVALFALAAASGLGTTYLAQARQPDLAPGYLTCFAPEGSIHQYNDDESSADDLAAWEISCFPSPTPDLCRFAPLDGRVIACWEVVHGEHSAPMD